MAYNFITIPSLTDIFARLKLYLLSGKIALANHAIGQADSFFRAAISLLPDVPKTIELDNKNKSSEPYFVEYINHLISSLLVVPDHPEHGVMYLVRGLLNALQEYPWEESSDAKCKIYMNAVCLLSASCQETYLYSIKKVDSNDKLYGHGQKFIVEVIKIIDTLVKQVLEQYKTLREKSPRNLSSSALNLFNRICVHGDISNEYMIKLAMKLWMLAKGTGQSDRALMKRTKQWVATKARTSPTNREAWQKLSQHESFTI